MKTLIIKTKTLLQLQNPNGALAGCNKIVPYRDASISSRELFELATCQFLNSLRYLWALECRCHLQRCQNIRGIHGKDSSLLLR